MGRLESILEVLERPASCRIAAFASGERAFLRHTRTIERLDRPFYILNSKVPPLELPDRRSKTSIASEAKAT